MVTHTWGELCPTRRRRLLLAAAIYVVALGARLTVYVEARDWPTFTHPQIDEFTAHQIGLAFLHDATPSEVYLKGPLYMYFIAGVAWVFGPDPLRIRLFQAFLSSLTPVLIFLAAERIFGWRVGVISGLIEALFWTIVYYSLTIVDAALSSLLYVLLIYLLVVLDDGRWWKWPVCGAVLALGALSRPSVLAFAPVLAVIVLIVTWRRAVSPDRRWGRAGLARAILNVATLTAGCLLVILPVTVRNRIVGGEWVLIGAYGGQNLWIANSPRSDGKNVPIYVGEGVPQVTPVDPSDIWTSISLGNRIARYYAEESEGRPLRFGEIDAYFARIAIDYIRSHPGAFLAKSFKRFCFFLNAYEYPNERDIYWFCTTSRLLTGLSYVHFGLLCPVAVIGLALVIGRRAWNANLAYLVGLLGSLWLGGMFFVINARFRVVVVCLMTPLMAYGLVRLIGLFRRGTSWRTRGLTLAALAGLLVFCNVNVFGYREDHYTDQRMGFAVACAHQGRNDALFHEAVARFDEAMTEDLRAGRLIQTAIMEHACPLGWLFMYHIYQSNFDRALYYGPLMLQREPPDPVRAGAFFDLALRVGRRSDAEAALDVLLANDVSVHPVELARRLLAFGERYDHRPSLEKAEPMLQQLSQQHPMEQGYRRALDHVRNLLRAQRGTPTSSRPVATGPTHE